MQSSIGSGNELWTEFLAWCGALDGCTGFTAGELARAAAITTKITSAGLIKWHDLAFILYLTQKWTMMTTAAAD